MDNFDITALLKAYREEHDYSIRQMADKLHMSKSAYDRLEKGLTDPSYEEIRRILNILGLKSEPMNEIDTFRKLFAAIKHGLLYGSMTTAYALNCFKDLAEALKCQPLLEWAELETGGYWDEGQNVPHYRLYKAGYDIEYEQNSSKSFMSLPFEFIESFEERDYYIFPNPIDDVDEKWVKQGTIFPLREYLQDSLASLLKKVYGPDFKLIRAAGRITPQFPQKVLLTVQEIMLRFLLCLETDFDPKANVDYLRTHKHQLGMLFREVMETIGSGDHLFLPMKPETKEEVILIKGDEDRFCDWLDQHDITVYEEDDFFVLIDEFELDPPPEGIVPPEMYDWAKKVNSSNWRFREDEEKLIKGLKVLYGVK